MEDVWLTNVEMHFVTSVSWEVCVQHMLRCVFPSLALDGIAHVLAGIGCEWSTHDELCVVSTLAYEGFGKHILRSILFLLT
jgi:hypothetical protein